MTKQSITIHEPTSSKNFKTWFGKSVTHTEGVPTLFYHRSRSHEQFTEFRHKHVLKNPYNLDYGFYFVDVKDKNKISYIADGLHLYVFLRMENPYTITEHAPGQITTQDGETLEKIQTDEPYCKKIIARGFDSIIIKAQEQFYNQYIVFEPNQVKHIQNNGNFSIETDNMFE